MSHRPAIADSHGPPVVVPGVPFVVLALRQINVMPMMGTLARRYDDVFSGGKSYLMINQNPTQHGGIQTGNHFCRPMRSLCPIVLPQSP